ncbi:MAG: NADPH-dependent glutamate synthase [Gammaproteobacteria bacterium]|nr:NADPH-dependent glutamate synthase [Gammaproteobacteria bacterium]
MTRETRPRKKKKIAEIQPERTHMPIQDANERIRNFDEVTQGYTEQHALAEAERCLVCPKAKCVDACPVSIDIPTFIDKVISGDFRGAWLTVTDANLMPAVCGRVCPQEDQCEGVCVIGKKLEPVAIGRLERYLGDRAIEEGWEAQTGIEPNGKRDGIVGSGPAGIACAADMAKAGCEVTVFEALHKPGGVLRYGIPEFRLPDEVIDAEVDNLKDLGVQIECNTLVGRLFTIEQMVREMGFDAVFIGTGAGTPRFMNIPGEYLNGVLSANELLTRCNLMKAGDFPNHDTPLGLGKRVAVIGAGNTAMDALRVSLRLGADQVVCVYRRSFDEAPARLEEIEHAAEEGIAFHWLSAPVEILDDGAGNVRGLRCIGFELGDPDESGRRRPVPVEGSEFELMVDTVVYAIGTDANPIIGQTSEIGLNKWGFIATDENLATSIPGVYAGGDIVTGGATVILAMGAGRKAASSIKQHLGLP